MSKPVLIPVFKEWIAYPNERRQAVFIRIQVNKSLFTNYIDEEGNGVSEKRLDRAKKFPYNEYSGKSGAMMAAQNWIDENFKP